MSELKLTNDKMKTYNSEDNKGAFKTSARLEAFGNNQNSTNELLAANINELIKRVCALEDERDKHSDIMRRLASELSTFKAELDRLKLTAKLNTNAIARLSNAEAIISEASEDNEDK